jgi:hypothetical protein
LTKLTNQSIINLSNETEVKEMLANITINGNTITVSSPKTDNTIKIYNADRELFRELLAFRGEFSELRRNLLIRNDLTMEEVR